MRQPRLHQYGTLFTSATFEIWAREILLAAVPAFDDAQKAGASNMRDVRMQLYTAQRVSGDSLFSRVCPKGSGR
jgi:hypothetical protein